MTFEKTMAILGITEYQMKQFVSEGEIRLFREGDQMKFRKPDVKALAGHMINDEQISTRAVVISRAFTRVRLGLPVETKLDEMVADGSLWEFVHPKHGRVYLPGQVSLLARPMIRLFNHSDQAVMAWCRTPPAKSSASPAPIKQPSVNTNS